MPQLDSDGFIVVRHKSRPKSIPRQTLEKSIDSSNLLKPEHVDVPSLCRRIDDAVRWLQDSDFLQRFLLSLQSRLDDVSVVGDIQLLLCYGIGHLAISDASLMQTALMLHMRRYLSARNQPITDNQLLGDIKSPKRLSLQCPPSAQLVRCELYDPVFWPEEIDALQRRQLTVLTMNEHCARRIAGPTVVYMPHCENVHYEALLAANWNPEQLARCVLVGNCVKSLTLRLPPPLLVSLPLLGRISAHVASSGVNVSDRTDEKQQRLMSAFNDTAVQSFPVEMLRHLPGYYWNEPVSLSATDGAVNASASDSSVSCGDDVHSCKSPRRRRRRRRKKSRSLQ